MEERMNADEDAEEKIDRKKERDNLMASGGEGVSGHQKKKKKHVP